MNLNILKGFSKIIVTGTHRSGTTIAAKIFAFELKKIFYDEGYVGIYNTDRIFNLIKNETDFVCQGPSFKFHELIKLHDFKDVMVVIMQRNLKEVKDSRIRMSEIERNKGKLWLQPIDRLEEVNNYYTELDKILPNTYFFNYNDLKGHPLWINKKDRVKFRSKQTDRDGKERALKIDWRKK